MIRGGVVIERVRLEETYRECGERGQGKEGVCGQKRWGKMKREESSVFLDSGRENIAIARNVIHLSQVWENTSRISPKSVLQVCSLALVI